MKNFALFAFLLISTLSYSQLDLIAGCQINRMYIGEGVQKNEVLPKTVNRNTSVGLQYTMPGDKVDFDFYLQTNWLPENFDATFGGVANFAKVNGVPILGAGIEFSNSQRKTSTFVRAQYEYHIHKEISIFAFADSQFIDGMKVGDAARVLIGFRFFML